MKNLCLPFLFCFSTLCSQAQWLVQNTNFTNPHNCMMIDVVDANVAWTSGWTGNFATMGGWSVTTDDHTFSRTIDGQNWQQGIFDPDGNGLITGLSAVDANTAFIAYNDYGADNSAQVLKTTDGGLNWDSLHVGIFYWINFVHAFDANNIIAMGDPDAEGFQVYISSDGGTTWERIDPFLLAANSGEFGPVNTYSVDGNVTFSNVPSTGTLTVSVGAVVQTFNPPFSRVSNKKGDAILDNCASPRRYVKIKKNIKATSFF